MTPRKRLKALLWGAILGLLGCTQAPLVPSSLTPEGHTFQVQALTEGYVARKVRHWLNQDNEPALVREIEFARVKHPDLMEGIMLADPALYAQVAAVPAVDSQRSNATFDAFMVRLSGFLPILSYQMSAVATGSLTPQDVAVDSAGNLYVADTGNDRIQKITPAGVVSTLATGLSSLQGIGTDAQANVFAVSGARVFKITPQGVATVVAGGGGVHNNGVLATTVALSFPRDVAVDSTGNLYLSELGTNFIRKVDTEGIITTLAGDGTQSFLGEGTPAVNARLSFPTQLIVDTAGNIFFVDSGNHRVRKITPAGIISTVAGNGSPYYSGDGGLAIEAGLANPTGVAVDTVGNVFISNSNVNYYAYIRRVLPNGTIEHIAGFNSTGNTGDGGPSTSAYLRGTQGLAANPLNNEIFIADRGNARIRKLIPQYE
jgi:hypothetical protein